MHQWRSQQMAILVGTNTALLDDPELTTRLWPGKNPIRFVIDMNLRLPQSLKLFNGSMQTIVFNRHQHTIHDLKNIQIETGVHYYQVSENTDNIFQIVQALYQMNIQSFMVEGGTQLLQSFIDTGLWDEAIVITNNDLQIQQGIPAPELKHGNLHQSEVQYSDHIHYYKNSFN
jgi:diaminohydroxyphosphoribosylaminopyrimidine deaminase/5-amino-6-(5-phosphoribosylamino)uracil reductase